MIQTNCPPDGFRWRSSNCRRCYYHENDGERDWCNKGVAPWYKQKTKRQDVKEIA